jgi:hypothetical protein
MPASNDSMRLNDHNTYTLREAAQLLGVDRNTLVSYLQKADIEPKPDPSDLRRRLITGRDIKKLSEMFKRNIMVNDDDEQASRAHKEHEYERLVDEYLKLARQDERVADLYEELGDEDAAFRARSRASDSLSEAHRSMTILEEALHEQASRKRRNAEVLEGRFRESLPEIRTACSKLIDAVRSCTELSSEKRDILERIYQMFDTGSRRTISSTRTTVILDLLDEFAAAVRDAARKTPSLQAAWYESMEVFRPFVAVEE